MRSPSRAMRPASGLTTPHTRLNSEVLPAPLGPIRPSTRPFLRTRSMRSATTMPPNALHSPSTTRTSVTAAAPWRASLPDVRRGDEPLRSHEHEDEHEAGEQQALQRAKHAG